MALMQPRPQSFCQPNGTHARVRNRPPDTGRKGLMPGVRNSILLRLGFQNFPIGPKRLSNEGVH
eukprot:COSAG03_NODE_10144_length_669_cov_1.347368_2_plen_63_part_01